MRSLETHAHTGVHALKIASLVIGLMLATPMLAQEELAEGKPTGPAPPAESSDEEVWYTERISSGDAPVRVEHLWSRGDRMRAETVFLGHPIVTIINGDRYIMFDRLAGTGVSIERSSRAIQDDASRARPFGNEFAILLEAGGEKVRTEEMGGRVCDVYRLTSSRGRREVCVTPDEDRLPLFRRVWLRGSSQTGETRYLEWSRNIEIPDAFFQPGSQVKLEYVSYDDYVKRASKERIGPAPPMHRELLHGQ